MGIGGVSGGERRAMGDSSHYEEIALIGNGKFLRLDPILTPFELIVPCLRNPHIVQ